MTSVSRPWNELMVDEVMDEGKRRRNAWTCFVYGDNTLHLPLFTILLWRILGGTQELQHLTDNVDLAFVALQPIAQIRF